MTQLPRVVGIGGVFIRTKDHALMREWYRVHLDIDAGEWGKTFEWDAPTSTRRSRIRISANSAGSPIPKATASSSGNRPGRKANLLADDLVIWLFEELSLDHDQHADECGERQAVEKHVAQYL